jgi:predicted phage terminase large subunit-like protein
LPNERYMINIGMDLAFTVKQENDWIGLVTTARNRSTNDYFVADAYRFKATQPQRMLEELKKFNAKWHASKILVESVQARAAIIRQWQDESDLPIVPIRPEKDKLTRLQPIAQLYADGRVWHSEHVPQYFEDELTLFPVGEHDDLCDALAYSIMGFGNYWNEDQTSGRHWGQEPSQVISEDECEAA